MAGSDTAAYQAAFGLLKNSQYDQAITAFQQFLASYPDSSLADNAQYWLGEAYYVNKAFPEALAAFQRVVDKYPQSRKLPDALFKVGYCDYELKQWQAAHDTLSRWSPIIPTLPPANWRSNASRRWRRRTIECRLQRETRAPAHQRDLPLAAGRGRLGRISHGVRAPDRLSACDAGTATPSMRFTPAIGTTRVDPRVGANVRYAHVCVTGGEPLAQPNCLLLLERLCDAGFKVSLGDQRRDVHRRGRCPGGAGRST